MSGLLTGMLRYAAYLLCAVATPACAASLPAGENARPNPNVVLIVADDLGWADLACYGGDLHETPNLDRLAKQGLRFTDAYAAAPICSPTRASIMTGKYPARMHMTIWYEASQRPRPKRRVIPPATVGNLPHHEVTIAEVLHSAGYYTAHVGKWHLGEAGYFPQTQGFNVNVGGTHWGAPPTYFYPYRGPFGGQRELRYVPDLPWGEPGEYLTDRLTDEALENIERLQDRPFFLHLCYHTVHTPIEAKQPDIEHFRSKITAELHHQNPVFAAMVRSLDQNIGRLLSKLDELDLEQNTVVIFVSDNGGYIGAHGGMKFVTNNHPLRSGKGSLWEGGIRVPLIIRAPGVTKPGTLCREPVVTTDLYPTLLELLRQVGDSEHNAKVDGTSLARLLTDPEASLERDAIYFHYPHYYSTTTPVGAVRVGGWKLLEFYEDMHVELYNLNEDIGERHDLSGKKPEKTAAMRGRLHEWRASIGAQMPDPNPNFRAR